MMEINITIFSRKTGFWSAVALGALFALYAACFIGILAGGPAFLWTDMRAFLEYDRAYDQTLKYVSYAGMMLFGVVYVVLLHCLGDNAPPAGRLFARLAASFAAMFALSTGMNYFVQLTTVRLKLAGSVPAGLELFVMGDPASAMAALNMLGWTFLMSLASLCASLSLRTAREAGPARACLLLNAAVCFAGGIGFVLDHKLVVGICMYPLLGGAVTAVAVSLASLFRKWNRCAEPAKT